MRSLGKLTLTFDKYLPILDAVVEQGAFRGQGCAYFAIGQEKAFLEALRAYPIERAELLVRNPGEIGIAIRPSDRVGHFAVTISVAEDMPSTNTTRIVLRGDYAQITHFRDQIELMAKGELTEITLTEFS